MKQFQTFLLPHNLYWSSPDLYFAHDKHLQDLALQKFQFVPDWHSEITGAGIYVLFGGRQIGKTTSLKLLIKNLIKTQSVSPSQVLYLPCDTILDRSELFNILRDFLSNIVRSLSVVVVIDEVTYVRDWWLSIKGLIDEGSFRNAIVLITGSDRVLLENSASSFPGVARRGKEGKDIILTPLRFSHVAQLVHGPFDVKQLESDPSSKIKFEKLFFDYLNTGGFLTAINDLAVTGHVSDPILKVYEQWIVSEFVRRGKDKRRLFELLRVLYETLGTQVSYTRLAQNSAQLSTDTLIEYMGLLERLGVIVTLGAFDQNSLSSYPKKDKKIHLRDPLFVHVILKILKNEQILPAEKEANQSYLVECATLASYADTAPLYYIKGEGEVDLVIVRHGKFLPIEIKWTERLRSEELKQVKKYKNGLVLCKKWENGIFDGLTVKNVIKELVTMTGKTYTVR